jgi:hypothetical protein
VRGGLLCVAAVAVLLLAACGGSGGGGTTTTQRLSAGAYRAQLEKVKADAAGAQAHVGQGLQSKTVADLKAKVDAFATATQRISDEVAKLNPPANADTANSELAQGLHDISVATHAASAKIAKMKTVQEAITYLEHARGPVKGSHEVDHALKQLKKLGYTTGS